MGVKVAVCVRVQECVKQHSITVWDYPNFGIREEWARLTGSSDTRLSKDPFVPRSILDATHTQAQQLTSGLAAGCSSPLTH